MHEQTITPAAGTCSETVTYNGRAFAPTSTAPTSAPRTNADDGTHTCRMCRCHTDRPNRSILFDGCAGCGCDQDW